MFKYQYPAARREKLPESFMLSLLSLPSLGEPTRIPMTEQGEKMVEIIKNIKEESERVGYDPEKDTNWCHLPKELREKCIKKMDLVTRIDMRESASVEKSFVDAHKYYFDKVLIETKDPYARHAHPLTSFSMKLITSNPMFPRGTEQVRVGVVSMFGTSRFDLPDPSFKLCEYGEIECFSFGTNVCDLDYLAQAAPFRFKSLKSKGGNLKMAEFFLRHSVGDVEKIRLNVKHEDDFSIDRFLSFPSFIRAKQVVIEFMALHILLVEQKKLLAKWNENDMEIGSSCHFSTGKVGDLIIGDRQERKMLIMRNQSKACLLIINIDVRRRQGQILTSVVANPPPVQAESQRTQ